MTDRPTPESDVHVYGSSECFLLRGRLAEQNMTSKSALGRWEWSGAA